MVEKRYVKLAEQEAADKAEREMMKAMAEESSPRFVVFGVLAGGMLLLTVAVFGIANQSRATAQAEIVETPAVKSVPVRQEGSAILSLPADKLEIVETAAVSSDEPVEVVLD